MTPHLPTPRAARRSLNAVMWALALGAALPASAAGPATRTATPAPGVYATEGGFGQLTVQAPVGGASRFAIETQGANGHSCALDGTIRGGRAQLDTTPGDPACVIGFEPLASGYRVSGSGGGECRYFCGARAGFEFDYLPLPTACETQQVQRQRDRFLRDYKAKRYGDAAPVLQTLLTQCERWLNWFEVGEVRNDLAITQYHLGQKAACRATLAPVAATATRNRQTLQASLPPTDFESYLPIAKATWHNLKLCRR